MHIIIINLSVLDEEVQSSILLEGISVMYNDIILFHEFK